MGNLISGILTIAPMWVYVVVFALVFVEDAIFVGFVVPGETAAVLGGVDASRGHTALAAMIILVVLAAIVGDSVGYEVGKRFVGPRILARNRLKALRPRIDAAQSYLQRKGGAAVFFGRFTAFFRAVMPALAGASNMPYGRFLRFNALGGVVWGTGFVLLGFLAGNSYKVVEQYVGRGLAIVVAAIVVVALVVWHLRRKRREPTPTASFEG